MALRPCTADGAGLAHEGRHQTLVFQAVECRIDSAQGYGAAGALLDFSANRYSVCILTQPHQGQQHHLLEFT